MRALAIIALLTCSIARAEPPHEETVVVDDPGAARKQVALGVAIAGTTLLAASGAVSAVALHNYQRCVVDQEVMTAPQNPNCPFTNVSDATDYANQQSSLASVAGTSLFLAGGVALGAALYLYVTAPPKHRVVRVGAAPDLSTGGISFAVSGSF